MDLVVQHGHQTALLVPNLQGQSEVSIREEDSLAFGLSVTLKVLN